MADTGAAILAGCTFSGGEGASSFLHPHTKAGTSVQVTKNSETLFLLVILDLFLVQDRAGIEALHLAGDLRGEEVRVGPSDRLGQRDECDEREGVRAFTAEGDAFLAAWTHEAFLTDMRFWEQSMNHYLKTGQPLTRTPEPVR